MHAPTNAAPTNAAPTNAAQINAQTAVGKQAPRKAFFTVKRERCYICDQVVYATERVLITDVKVTCINS